MNKYKEFLNKREFYIEKDYNKRDEVHPLESLKDDYLKVIFDFFFNRYQELLLKYIDTDNVFILKTLNNHDYKIISQFNEDLNSFKENSNLKDFCLSYTFFDTDVFLSTNEMFLFLNERFYIEDSVLYANNFSQWYFKPVLKGKDRFSFKLDKDKQDFFVKESLSNKKIINDYKYFKKVFSKEMELIQHLFANINYIISIQTHRTVFINIKIVYLEEIVEKIREIRGK